MTEAAWGATPSVLTDTAEGDVLELDQYLTEVEVTGKWATIYGPALVVKSTSPQASSSYRLRATPGASRLVLEKNTDQGWTAHCRVNAERKTQTDD